MTDFFTEAGLSFFRDRLDSNPRTVGGNTQDEDDKEQIRIQINQPSNEWVRQVAAQLPEYAYIEDNKVL